MKRNERQSSLKAHLFADDDVAAAGGSPDAPADSMVVSLCGRAESYGPFRETTVADAAADDAVCGSCISVWASRRAAAESETETETENGENADTPENAATDGGNG